MMVLNQDTDTLYSKRMQHKVSSDGEGVSLHSLRSDELLDTIQPLD